MSKTDYLRDLEGSSSFSRQEHLQSFRTGGYELSEASFSKELTKMVRSGEILRVGKNVYSFPRKDIAVYEHEYSALAVEVAALLREKFPLLDFSLLELIQLNDFVNHQIAHNIIFLSVEADIMDFVFEALKERYFGKVLINPTPQIYHQYWSDNMIVIVKLVTEAPKDHECPWHTGLEKFLVDIMAEPLLAETVIESEYPGIYEDALSRYICYENRLFRYAKRRRADEKIRRLIEEKTDIVLSTGR